MVSEVFRVKGLRLKPCLNLLGSNIGGECARDRGTVSPQIDGCTWENLPEIASKTHRLPSR